MKPIYQDLKPTRSLITWYKLTQSLMWKSTSLLQRSYDKWSATIEFQGSFRTYVVTLTECLMFYKQKEKSNFFDVHVNLYAFKIKDENTYYNINHIRYSIKTLNFYDNLLQNIRWLYRPSKIWHFKLRLRTLQLIQIAK